MAYVVAVVGATGAVGAQMIKMLEESTLPIEKVRLLASARSAGKPFNLKDKRLLSKKQLKLPLKVLILRFSQLVVLHLLSSLHTLLRRVQLL